MELQGTKVLIGDDPAMAGLWHKYPDAVFMGEKHGDELARHYAGGDVFVFPSKTDTFGTVMVEALASGIPMAAYPVTGPIDVITSDKVVEHDNHLKHAAMSAPSLHADDCREYALDYSWENCARTLESRLVRNHWG